MTVVGINENFQAMREEGELRVFHCEWDTWNICFLRNSCPSNDLSFNYPSIIGVPIFNFNSWGGIPTKFSVLMYSVGYRSSTSPPSCPCGMASSWLVYVVVYPGSILITFALITSAVSFFGHTIAFSCILIQDVFSGSDSPGTPTVPSPTLRSRSANVDTSSFSASDKFPWVEESFSSNGNLNHEWVVRPDGSNIDAILEEATTSTIFPTARSAYIIVFHKNVFPVPPWPLGIPSDMEVTYVEAASFKLPSHYVSSPNRPIASHAARHVGYTT
nr:hypothetical protein [Tanacetum cinerariifolium]